MLTKKQLRVSLGKTRRLVARYFPQIRIGLVVFGLVLLSLLIRTSLPWLVSFGRLVGDTFSGGISLISQSAEDLKGENGRVNLLLLGISGGERSGADLTDTIIFVSVDPKTGKTLILSLPRDIWLASMRAKLNTAYHYGNQKKPRGGLVLAKAAVSEILNQPVDYGVVVNFAGFEQIIDILGGVTVEVENSFDDYHYPIPGKENDDCGGDPEYRCRYEHLHFDAGEQEMDGERALKYARSRYAEGEEGTDFARSQRQQRLLVAIKNKVLSPQTLLDPRKPLQLIKVVVSSIETDIPQEKYADLIKPALRFRSKNLRMEVLDDNYLITPPPSKEKYDNQWVLIPRTGDWEEVQGYIACLIEKRECQN